MVTAATYQQQGVSMLIAGLRAKGLHAVAQSFETQLQIDKSIAVLKAHGADEIADECKRYAEHPDRWLPGHHYITCHWCREHHAMPISIMRTILSFKLIP